MDNGQWTTEKITFLSIVHYPLSIVYKNLCLNTSS